MAEFLRQHWAYLIGALLLHVLFAGIFALTMVSLSRKPPPAQLAIQAVVVDQSVLARASRQQQRDRERAEQRQRERAAAEQRRQQEENARRDAEQRAEQERQIEQQRREDQQRREAEEQQVRERQEAERRQQAEKQRAEAEAAERQRKAEAERQRQAEAERKRVAEIERKQKEAAEQRRAAEEARAQQTRENELRNQLAEEEGVMQAESSGLLNQYIAMIEQRIVRNWNRPPSARSGLECEVRVTQAPSGTVLSVQLGTCNGDAAVRQSIEAAVMRSSPLPPAPDQRLFQRVLVLRFKPLD
jgi:colicin import membrane protein